ncbi:MAG: RelA/SpoT domain-containing protein [Corynebacterium glutamicum]|nr:RelA/SpoT domain-containing protein [Corynebacterium glutamicum]
MREGKPYDQELLDEYMIHHTVLIDEVQSILLDAFDSSFLSKAGDSEDITPYSKRYRFSARPKMTKTLVEKLRRMGTTPIHRIQDIAGLRFDFDSNLTAQYRTADYLAERLTTAGANRAKVIDLRESPHSGYRAIHIHVNFEAGRAEVQLRTALQAQWANVYEVAADVFGREIRYSDLEEIQDSLEVRSVLEQLHKLSDSAYNAELWRDHFDATRKNFNDEDLKVVKFKEDSLKIYDNMEDLVRVFTAFRDGEPWEYLLDAHKER